MMLSVTRTCIQPHDGDIKNDSDIDRWENDGGRSVTEKSNFNRISQRST